jgi:hypothetical protein
VPVRCIPKTKTCTASPFLDGFYALDRGDRGDVFATVPVQISIDHRRHINAEGASILADHIVATGPPPIPQP